MRFDDFWPADDDDQPAGEDLELIPDGRHKVLITRARVRDIPFKQSENNPQGTTLAVEVLLNGYQVAEDLIPVTFRGLIRAVCQAANVMPPRRGVDWEPSVLDGQHAQVEATRRIAKSGREYVTLKWIALPTSDFVDSPKVEKATASPGAPRRRPAAARTEGDDIPF